jgi:hypothetical protein
MGLIFGQKKVLKESLEGQAQSKFVGYSLAYPFALALASFSCLKGPSFMQTQTESSKNTRSPADTIVDSIKTSATINRVIVPMTFEGSKSKGKVDANSPNVQVIQASENSKIAGSQVEFPPGSLAIDTEISMQPGQQVATDQSLQSLAIDSQVASKSTPMVVTSSVALDTSSPFSLTLPIPNTGSSLVSEFPQFGLADPLSNLVIFYNVQIAAENRNVAGIIPRRDIEIVNGYARIFTRHFGTFQTAILTKPVESPVQIAAVPLPPPPNPMSNDSGIASRRYYVKGPATTSGGQSSIIRAWVPTVSPMIVGTTSTLTVGVMSYPSPE